MGYGRWGLALLSAMALACGKSDGPGDEGIASATGGLGNFDDGGSDGAADGDGGAGEGGGAGSGPADGGSDGAGDGTPGDSGAADGGAGTGTDGGGDGGSTGGQSGPMPIGLCNEAPPPGAAHAPPPPSYSGGSCPPLVPGHNPIASSGANRDFILVVPTDMQDDETLPLLFLWHWLGGSADSFLNTGQVQEAADEFRFIAAIPQNKGDLALKWPYTVLDSNGRINEEVTFFDDMLACVSEQYSVNNDCVSSAGVSAGALWTSQLGWRRGERLASFLTASGGTGAEGIQPWGGTSHKLPAFVLWGGPNDNCGINFQQTSQDLENHLTSEGHFMVECIHNCGHAAPPFDVPDGTNPFAPLWQFALDHPFWLSAGESPWMSGFPENTPDWCAIGKGSATMRSGPCGGSAC